ncbi:MAG: hypothetical protein WC584_05340 [Candidatus Pacearchaeota archaeon]
MKTGLQSELNLNGQEGNLDLRFSCFVHLMERQRKVENHFVAEAYCKICDDRKDLLFMGGIVNDKGEIVSMYFMCSDCDNIINMKDYQHRGGN